MISKTLTLEFLSFLNKYKDFYADFLINEQLKYDSIMQNDLALLDKYVLDEQAYILKSKGLEIERESMLKKLNCSEITFKEIIPLCDEEFQGQINDIFTELSDVLLELKSINIRSNSLTELRLHKIKNMIKNLNRQPELQKSYDKNASESLNQSSLMSKKI